MLICIRYQHFTDRKDEEFDFDECSQLKSRSKKNGRRKAKIFQNKCVSSQKGRIKKRRGRYRSGVSPTFSQLAASLFRWAVLGSKQR